MIKSLFTTVKSIVTFNWGAEPVLILTALGVIVKTAAAIKAGSVDWATGVEDGIIAVAGLTARAAVTAPDNLPSA